MLGRPCFSCGSFELWAQTALRRRRTLGAVGAAGWAGTGAGRYWLQHSMQRVGLRAQRAARWAESTPELLPPVQLAQPALSQILVAMAQGFGRVLVAQGARGTALLVAQHCLDSAAPLGCASWYSVAWIRLGQRGLLGQLVQRCLAWESRLGLRCIAWVDRGLAVPAPLSCTAKLHCAGLAWAWLSCPLALHCAGLACAALH